ncbi:hypothetical protein A2U01_0040817, partial [Trifolium medium]|nr:hypothetical protein [Trifolium medium]
MPVSEATWEDEEPLQLKFPSLNLEDKVIFNGGSIVREEGTSNRIGSDNMASNTAPDKTNEEMMGGPKNVEVRRSMRERKRNRKYAQEERHPFTQPHRFLRRITATFTSSENLT